VTRTAPPTSNFTSGEVEPIPTLKSESTENELVLINLDNSRALVIAQLLSSYLGHKKRPPSLLLGGREVLVVNQKRLSFCAFLLGWDAQNVMYKMER